MKMGVRNYYDYMWKLLSSYKERFSSIDCAVSDREASTMTKPWPTKGYQAIIKNSVFNIDEITATL
jgi:hypothetical protein